MDWKDIEKTDSLVAEYHRDIKVLSVSKEVAATTLTVKFTYVFYLKINNQLWRLLAAKQYNIA